MLLKKVYHQDKLRRGPDGTVTAVLPDAVKTVRVLRAKDRQNFTPALIEKGVAEGWLTMAKGRVTIHGEGGDVVYQLVRAPGYYCCHCQEPLDGGQAGQKHVAQQHPGVPSPDQNNPAGYRRDNFYAGVREG